MQIAKVLVLLCMCIAVCCADVPAGVVGEQVAEDPATTPLSGSLSSLMATLEKSTSLEFVHAFVASFAVILVSEIGDKTFFIAAIMAMTHPRATVFAGALAALAVMTAMSAFLGFVTVIIPRWVTYYTATALLGIFGVRMLQQGYQMSPEEAQEEMEEVTQELKAKQSELDSRRPGDVESGGTGATIRRLLSPVFVQAFILTFLAEWGDRSQITTVILAAREDALGVTIGGICGHAICTGGAVLGGRMLAQRISVRTVTLVGGIVFLVFCVVGFLSSPE